MKRVLVVEDEDMLRRLYHSVLSENDKGPRYEVVSVSSAEEALQQCGEKSFDVVLTDYRLPGENGVKLIKRIVSASPSTLCILLSGFLESGLVRSALEAGAVQCLKKPCELAEILSAVQQSSLAARSSRKNEARITSVVEANVLSTVFVDSNYSIVYANKSFSAEYGECKGQKCYEVLGTAPGLCPNCKAVAASEGRSPLVMVHTGWTSNGRIAQLREKIEPWYDPAGKSIGMLISICPIDIQEDNGSIIKSIKPAGVLGEGQGFMVFALDEEGRFVFADEYFARFCGVSQGKLLGNKITKYLHSYLGEYLSKNEQSFVDFAEERLDEAVRVDFIKAPHGQRATLTCEFRSEESFRETNYYLLVIARSEEEQKHLRRLIEFQRESSRQLFSGNFDMVLTTNTSKEIVTINQIFEKKFGCKQNEIGGKSIYSIVSNRSDLASLDQAFERASTLHGVYNLRIDLEFQGKLIPTLVNIRGVHDTYNNEMGFVLVLRDIEKELRMGSTLASIERMQALGQLAAGTAHQLNNYIVVLSGYFNMLFNDVSCETVSSESIENIRSTLVRLDGLTKHLMDYAKAQEAPVMSLGNVNKTIEDVNRLVQTRVNEKHVGLNFDLATDLPEVCFSPLHLEQVVLNIVNNAIDAVQEQKGTIRVASYSQGDHVCIEVEDNGCGIPDKIKNHIFDAFVTSKPKTVGTGLGLAVARSVISSLGGTIDANSRQGNGTRIVVSLPKPEQTGAIS